MALAQHLLVDRQGLLVEGPGSGVVTRRGEQIRQVVQAGGVVGVALAQYLLAHRQGLLVEGPGSGVVTLRPEQQRQVVQALGVVGVALAQYLLANRQGPPGRFQCFTRFARPIQYDDLPVQAISLGQLLPLIVRHPGPALNVFQGQPRIGHSPVGRAVTLPQDLQGFLPGRLRRREILPLEIQPGQPAQRDGQDVLVRGQGLPLDRQRGLGSGGRLRQLPRGVKLLALNPEALPFLEGRLHLLRIVLAEGRRSEYLQKGERHYQHNDGKGNARNR